MIASFLRKYYILMLIILLALILRVFQLSQFPVGFHADEANIGYNAYSLLKTAHDKNGVFLPLSVDEFGDFRPAGYHYVDTLSVQFFGLNEFSTRFPSALFGALLIIPLFFLVRKISSNEKVALISSALMAISPWAIIVSRATSESVLAMFCVITGFYFLIHSVNSKRKIYFGIISIIFLTVSLFFYHAARFFVPVFTPVLSILIALNIKEKSTRKFLFVFNILVIILSLLVFAFSSGSKRPLEVSIFTSSESKLILEEQIREDGGQSAIVTRVLHNKFVSYANTFISNYLQYFTGDYLFLTGGLPQRYTIPQTGNMYPIELPFLVAGFCFLLSQKDKQKRLYALIPIIWLLIAPIPAALTFEDSPNIQRSIMMLPALVMITGFGVWTLFSFETVKKIKPLLAVIVIIIFSYSFVSFLHEYFHHSLTHRPWYRSVGEKDLISTLSQNYNNYSEIYMTSQYDNNIIYYLFYLKIDPSFYQKLGSPRDKNGLRFEKFHFTYDECPFIYPTGGKKNILYVNSGTCKVPLNADVIKTISRTDRTIAFRVLKVNPNYTPLPLVVSSGQK